MAAVALTFMLLLLLLMSPQGYFSITPSPQSGPPILYAGIFVVGSLAYRHILHVNNKAKSSCMSMPRCMLSEV